MDNMPGMEAMPHNDHQSNNHTMTTSMSMTHMTFFWGRNSEILFSGWPGKRTGMYVLALVFVFVLSVLVEWLSHCRWMYSEKESNSNFCGGVVRTIVHGLRIGLGYLVMLAVMSFNVGVFIVVVAGHIFGFFLFGSRLVFNKSVAYYGKDLPNPCC